MAMLRRSLTSVFATSRTGLRRFCTAPAIQPKELPTKADGEPIPDFMTLTISSPTEAIIEDVPARLVTVPGSGGAFGIMPGHIPVLCELQPGVLSIYYEMGQTAGKQDHYFISGGFCLVHPNSTMEVAGINVCKVDDIDANLVNQNLSEARAKAGQAKTETEVAEAQIEVAVLEKLSQVLTFGSPK